MRLRMASSWYLNGNPDYDPAPLVGAVVYFPYKVHRLGMIVEVEKKVVNNKVFVMAAVRWHDGKVSVADACDLMNFEALTISAENKAKNHRRRFNGFKKAMEALDEPDH